MRLWRLGPEGFFAVSESTVPGEARYLHSDPLVDAPSTWQLGRKVDLDTAPLLPPIVPPKIVGIGRNYADHAKELDNPVPVEPVLFLKSPDSVIGPDVPIVLPPESERVEYEGEIAVVVRRTLRRADADQARAAILGVTAACDVTARDLQRRDPTFARAKSFDTFCPLGPAILVEPELGALEVQTRIDGEVRQRGVDGDMLFGIVDLLVYVSRMMTLHPGDVMLTGTPAGVGRLEPGATLEVEVSGVGTLSNPVEAWSEVVGR